MTWVCKCTSRGCGRRPSGVFLDKRTWTQHQQDEKRVQCFQSTAGQQTPLSHIDPLDTHEGTKREVFHSTLTGPDPIPDAVAHISSLWDAEKQRDDSRLSTRTTDCYPQPRASSKCATTQHSTLDTQSRAPLDTKSNW